MVLWVVWTGSAAWGGPHALRACGSTSSTFVIHRRITTLAELDPAASVDLDGQIPVEVVSHHPLQDSDREAAFVAAATTLGHRVRVRRKGIRVKPSRDPVPKSVAVWVDPDLLVDPVSGPPEVEHDGHWVMGWVGGIDGPLGWAAHTLGSPADPALGATLPQTASESFMGAILGPVLADASSGEDEEIHLWTQSTDVLCDVLAPRLSTGILIEEGADTSLMLVSTDPIDAADALDVLEARGQIDPGVVVTRGPDLVTIWRGAPDAQAAPSSVALMIGAEGSFQGLSAASVASLTEPVAGFGGLETVPLASGGVAVVMDLDFGAPVTPPVDPPRPAPRIREITGEVLGDEVCELGGRLTVRMIPYLRHDGSLDDGIRLTGLRRSSVWERVGLQNGDVFHGVVGQAPTDGEDDEGFEGFEARFYEALSTAGDRQLSLSRRGQGLVLDVTVHPPSAPCPTD